MSDDNMCASMMIDMATIFGGAAGPRVGDIGTVIELCILDGEGRLLSAALRR